ncbi:MAG: DUF6786 family protein [Mariniphaga sp.]
MYNIYLFSMAMLFLFSIVAPISIHTQMEESKAVNTPGNYAQDKAFLKSHKIDFIELTDQSRKACLLISPTLQGRVVTSTDNGENGKSYGWINYKYINSGELSSQFNPYGGEERLWLGPEGGPFSIYFQKGKEQSFENWKVPKEIDTESFIVRSQTSSSVSFFKNFALVNASGMKLEVGIERTVKLLAKSNIEEILAINLGDSLSYVAYESENILMNQGKVDWNEKNGFLSIWLLSMFNPTEKAVVFVPFKQGNDAKIGKVVTDDYFGKVPDSRLKQKNGMLFFKVDGKLRSKIGISPNRAKPWCGSYDPASKLLTLVWCSLPEMPMKFVNSKWGKQDDPLVGDAINSYNDGPLADGSMMGPFYEIETSSPAALLSSGEFITHRQRIFHISGNESQLSLLTQKLFGISVTDITKVFQ